MQHNTEKKIVDIRPILLEMAASGITGGPVKIDKDNELWGKEAENFGFDLIDLVHMFDRKFHSKKEK